MCWPEAYGNQILSIPCFETLNGVKYDITSKCGFGLILLAFRCLPSLHPVTKRMWRENGGGREKCLLKIQVMVRHRRSP